MTTTSVKFDIESDAVNYAATLEKDGELIGSIDKSSSGSQTLELTPGSYEARVYFRGPSGSKIKITVTVDGKAPKSKEFKMTSKYSEGRGGLPFKVPSGKVAK